MIQSCICDYLFDAGYERVLSVSGHSMHPTLKQADKVSIRREKTPYVHGNIYVFLNKKRLVCHRLIWYNKKNAYFCGDNSTVIESIPVEDIIGICDLHEKTFYTVLITTCNILAHVTGRKLFHRLKRFIIRRSYLYEKRIREANHHGGNRTYNSLCRGSRLRKQL